MKNSERIVGLDMVRTTAIFFVIFGHASFLFNHLVGLPLVGRFILYITTFSEIIAFLGVEIFFVLSGFLISKILVQMLNNSTEKKSFLKSFYSSRWLRTLPNYYLFLIINSIIYSFLTNQKNIDIRFLFFLQNFYTPHPTFYREAWSLAVEEWYYLLFPLVVLFLLHKRITIKNTILTVAGLFIVCSMLLKLSFILWFPTTKFNFDEYFRKIVLFRFDSIAIGIFGYWLSLYFEDKWIKYKNSLVIICAVLFLLLLFLFFQIYKYSYLLYYQSIFIYVIIALFFTPLCGIIILGFFPFFSKLKRLKNDTINRVFMFLSKISYSLYLCNLPVLFLFKRIIFIYSDSILIEIFNIICYFTLLIFMSFLIYNFYEKFFLKFRNKFYQ